MQQGFSMYMRGQKLKKCLINPDRVKEYLGRLEKEKKCKAMAEEQDKQALNDQLISLEDQSEGSGSEGRAKMMVVPKVPAALTFRGDSDLVFLQDNHIDEEKQWKLMLDYFKKNPDALMDAIPTPPGQEEDDEALKDFRTGLTPKRGGTFKFGGQEKRYNRPSYQERGQDSLRMLNTS